MSANAAEKAAVADETLFVQDPTARVGEPPRQHEMLEIDEASGQKRPTVYKFEAGEKKAMPLHMAVRFAKAGFIVTDENGAIYTPPTQASDEVVMLLQPGQCIARYDEMKQESLLMRAKAVIGGEKFNKATRVADLIAFLVEQDAKKAAEARARAVSNDDTAEDNDQASAGSATIGGAISPDALNRMFPIGSGEG